jgi:hypothetical protein
LKRKVHPIADLFPMMTSEELDELAGSIKANGLLSPVVVDTADRVLDGRNRLRACEIAKVEPEFETYEGDADAYALAVNLDRRMLTKGQKAMIAAKAATIGQYRFDTYEGDADAYALAVNLDRRMLTKGQKAMIAAKAGALGHLTTKGVGKVIGTSAERVSKASTVLDHAPDLADAVVAGTRSLDEASAERVSKASMVLDHAPAPALDARPNGPAGRRRASSDRATGLARGGSLTRSSTTRLPVPVSHPGARSTA